MLLAALAFVALMVFQWGMDITGQSSGGLGAIGEVNGEQVTYDAWMATYRNLYDQLQASQEEPITSQQNKELEDRAWDEIVNSILIRQELRRRGITVTDQEIVRAAQLSPPADLRPSFTTEDGQFDALGYQTFLASLPPDQLLLLEAYYRDVIPRGKLLRQVSSGIYVPDAELWRRYRDANTEVEVRFVALDPATRYDDADYQVSQDAVEAYYEENMEEFAIPARADVRAVVLDKTPTPADTVAMEVRAQSVRQEIVDGADFGEVAARESADEASASLGGELPVYAKGNLIPAFDSAVFSAPVEQVLGPVRTSYGFHVYEVLQRWAQDSVQARHILIPFGRTDDSEIELLTLADSLEDMGEAMALREASANAGLVATELQLNRDFPFIQGAGQISEGMDWIFEEAEPGDVSPVFETQQAFYAIELIEAFPEGFLSLEDARSAIESTLRFDQKMAAATAEAESIVGRVRAGEALESVAEELGLEIRQTEPFTRNDFVPGMGRQNAAIGAAFGLQPGQLSDVVTTATNAFIIEQLAYVPADSAAWLGQTVQQRQSLVAMREQLRLQEWIEALRASAKIVDRRAEVLAAPEEDVPQIPMVF